MSLGQAAPPGGPDDRVLAGRGRPAVARARPDPHVPPPLEPGQVDQRDQVRHVPQQHPVRGQEPQEVGPHGQRHQPRAAALPRRAPSRPVRELPLQFVVELDRERDESLRQHGRDPKVRNEDRRPLVPPPGFPRLAGRGGRGPAPPPGRRAGSRGGSAGAPSGPVSAPGHGRPRLPGRSLPGHGLAALAGVCPATAALTRVCPAQRPVALGQGRSARPGPVSLGSPGRGWPHPDRLGQGRSRLGQGRLARRRGGRGWDPGWPGSAAPRAGRRLRRRASRAPDVQAPDVQAGGGRARGAPRAGPRRPRPSPARPASRPGHPGPGTAATSPAACPRARQPPGWSWSGPASCPGPRAG